MTRTANFKSLQDIRGLEPRGYYTLASLMEVAEAQYAFNRDLNLFHFRTQGRALLGTPDAMLQDIFENRQAIATFVVSAATDYEQSVRHLITVYMSERMEQLIHRANQFVAFSPPERKGLYSIYTRLVDETCRELVFNDSPVSLRRALEAVLFKHYTALGDWLGSIGDAALFARVRSNQTLTRVPCHEYAAQLQLHVLRLDLADLKEPLLDVGCGANGYLVNYLRQRGVEAYGIDRHVAPSSYLVAADWFGFFNSPDAWGTILSHMAFSNHFIHHHLRTDGQPQAYALLMMQIPAALKISGSFYYAPGLSFIERLLPDDRYDVQKNAIAENSALKALRRRTGLETAYSTRITRLK